RGRVARSRRRVNRAAARRQVHAHGAIIASPRQRSPVTITLPTQEDPEMRSIVVASWTASLLSILVAAEPALAGDSFILATGRRDPRIYAIDFNAALRTSNDRTPNAIMSRSKTQVDRLDRTPVGDPANIVLSEDRRTAYVINHHGAVSNAEFLQ